MNVTISLSDELARKARHAAVDRGMSLSKFVATVLEKQLGPKRSYEEAMERDLKMMREGLDLGTYGKITVTRDELHERR